MANFALLLADFRPGAEWTLSEVNDYSTLIWLSPGNPPTEKQLLDREERFLELDEDRTDARRAIAASLNPRVRSELRGAEDPELFFDAVAERLRQDVPAREDRRSTQVILKAIEDTKVGGPLPRPVDDPRPRPPGSDLP